MATAEATGDESRDEASEPDASQDSHPSPSGLRVERETTPAPPGASEAWASVGSARPTSVPGWNLQAHGLEASLRHAGAASLPLDVTIPVRTSAPAPADLELRAAFLLLHVDGRSSVRAIAEMTGIPDSEVLTAMLALGAGGLVALGGAYSREPAGSTPPLSGERSREGSRDGEDEPR